MHGKGNVYRLSFGLVVLFTLAFLLLHLIPGGLMLVVKPVHDNEPAFVFPVQPADTFTLYYVHSVNGLPMWEKHSIDNRGMIYIEEEQFLAFGAGMGHWQGHGTLVDSGEYQMITGIHKPVGNFILRVAKDKHRHTIFLGNRSINLSQALAGKAVALSVEKVSLFEKVWRIILNIE